jgi:predicted ATP-dependent protease
MARHEALKPEVLCQSCDPQQLAFATTDELEDLPEVIGQPRAVAALHFGIGIKREGYNIYALGPAGIGKRWTVRHYLRQQADTEATPSDWCYVNNFEQPQKPRAMALPPGHAGKLQADMKRLVEELRSAIVSAFEGDDYGARKQVIESEIKSRQAKAFEDLGKQAQAQGIALGRTARGFVLAPLKDGEILTPDQVEELPEEEHKRIEAAIAGLQDELQTIMRQVLQLEKEGRDKLKALDHEVTMFAVGHLLDTMRKKYETLSPVLEYLDALQRDVLENVSQFLAPPESPAPGAAGIPHAGAPEASPFFRRYQVNALVDHGAMPAGAPVIYEDHPIYQNLIGQLDYVSQYGALSTDFNLIRAGALHRANGGYLVLDAQKILTEPYAWEGLKRALKSSEIRIESLGQALGLVSTLSLEPDPIPLRTKVVLVGDRLLYYLLCHHDPEFNALFKVAADFDDQMARTAESVVLYARTVATMARAHQLLPFDRGAVARLVEHSARLAGDAEKLSNQRMELLDLLQEADHWARTASCPTVTASHVQRAIDAQLDRAGRVPQLTREFIARGTILIDTGGAQIGQVNGLSVIQLGRSAFGQPSRITARVRLGRGEVVDIEREVQLGGPIHSKGVLILAGFLGARYCAHQPLSLRASLVFEQSYSGVEGDSASSAELYALLSALAEVPVRQSLAVTGSVNQFGQLQAIGGVNEKIEGFFDVCQAKGLTGEQGVVIPASNVKDLMLRRDVVEAARAGRFHVYAASTIDEGIEILTGMPAGERDPNGAFPEGTINYRVEQRLAEFANRQKAFAASAMAEHAHDEKQS